MRKLVFIVTSLILPLVCLSQDVHWSLINENSLYQNPSNAGLFSEDYRVSFTMRDQWRNVTKPFQSQAISFDAVNKYDKKLGYGAIFIHDVTGDGVFRTVDLRINGAYTLLDINKYKIRCGIELGIRNYQMNFSNYMFDNQFDGYIFSATLPSSEKFTTQQKTNLNLGGGLNISKMYTENVQLNLGVAVFNLNQANQSFYGINVPRFRRYNNYLQCIWNITSNIQINPIINFMHQNTYNEIIIGSKVNYITSKSTNDKTLIGGLYLRNKDAILTQIGLKIKQLKACVNYDINISKLTKASNGRGGIEFNIQYLWSRKKEKNLMHKKCLDYL